jgi:hypothetical protein
MCYSGMIVVSPTFYRMLQPRTITSRAEEGVVCDLEVMGVETPSVRLTKNLLDYLYEMYDFPSGCVPEILNSNPSTQDQIRDQANGNGFSRAQPGDPNVRPRFNNGMKNGFVAPHKRPPPPKQRVPEADEFPTLAGATAPSKSVNGTSGPTAAQILQAPAPFRRDSTRENSTRGPSPDSSSWKVSSGFSCPDRHCSPCPIAVPDRLWRNHPRGCDS